MAKKIDSLNVIGKWAFVIGLALAIIAGLIQGVYIIPSLALILVILGLLVGLLNIAEKDTIKLLVAIIALMSVGAGTLSAISIGKIVLIPVYLIPVLNNILIFAAAAGFVVAIKAIIETTKK